MPDMTVREVATELAVNPETVKRLLQDARLDGYKVGNRWRVTKEALDAYKGKSKNTRTSPEGDEVEGSDANG